MVASMLFNSLEYMIFLPAVFLLYWLLPQGFRWVWLLLSSYYFYMSWNPKYVVLILFTTGVSYGCALLLEKTVNKTGKKLIIALALLLCLGVLFFFKYFNFVSETVAELCAAIAIPIHPLLIRVLLPVGISFYTFQSLSYVIDVYRGTVKAERHFGIYAAFISFFPQLVAGPVERAEHLLSQIRSPKVFQYDEAVYGLRLMLLGFMKKLLLADSVAVYVNAAYGNVRGMSGMALILATVFFAFQIYCDFSGYSDIAVGTARLFGIRLMTNFKSPYFAASVKEFWSRWHISLSGWFRDYVYIPLGGSRGKAWRSWVNLLITFLASGLWHGAAWTFVAWGGLHGLYRIGEKLLSDGKKGREAPAGRLKNAIRTILTFCLVLAAWVFFRANSVWDGFYVLGHFWQGLSLQGAMAQLNLDAGKLAEIFLLIAALMLYDYASLKTDVLSAMGRLKLPVRWAVYTAATAALVIAALHTSGSQEFIYFQF